MCRSILSHLGGVLLISECSKHKKNIRLDTTGGGSWSTGNWARSLNLTVWTNDIYRICPRKCDTQNCLEFLRYKWTPKTVATWPDLVIVNKNREHAKPNSGLCHSSWLQGKTEWKGKER